MAKDKSKKSRTTWMQQHLDDPFVKKAQAEGYRSRSSYKLLEMDDRFRLIKPGMLIVDLGAAPGGWSQVAGKRSGKSGSVMALDILPMEPIQGVEFIQGDFQLAQVLEKLTNWLSSRQVDLVISDMAPNLSGMKAVDQPRSVHLTELALELADLALKEGGSLVTKCFEGEGIDSVRSAFKQRFKKISNFKPESSRDKSREIYLIGRDYVK